MFSKRTESTSIRVEDDDNFIYVECKGEQTPALTFDILIPCNNLWSYDINTFKLTHFETWYWVSVELKNTEYFSHGVQKRLTSSIRDGLLPHFCLIQAEQQQQRKRLISGSSCEKTGATTSNTALEACWSTLPMITEHRGKRPGGHDTESCINVSGWKSLIIDVLWFFGYHDLSHKHSVQAHAVQLGYGPIRELSPQRRLPLFLQEIL